ncbi:MAG: hypothetical protein U9N77_10155 [Thermodesulfobacteriota bacterium]|nr:hypothetical protein [Thermodesulfobacteriota bacterium]
MDFISRGSRRKNNNWIHLILVFILASGFFYGCATPTVKKLSHTRVLQPDQDDNIGGSFMAKVSERGMGKIVFMAREKSGKAINQILNEGELRDLGLVHSRSDAKIAGVDYFLGGEFIGASLECATVKQGVEATVGRSKDDPRVLEVEASEKSRHPNVAKYLNVLLMNANTGEIPIEKMIKVGRKMKSGLGRSDYILTGELSALSKAVQGGDRSDYVIMSFQIIEPSSNEILWEDAYETKKVSKSGVLYK